MQKKAKSVIENVFDCEITPIMLCYRHIPHGGGNITSGKRGWGAEEIFMICPVCRIHFLLLYAFADGRMTDCNFNEIDPVIAPSSCDICTNDGGWTCFICKHYNVNGSDMNLCYNCNEESDAQSFESIWIMTKPPKLVIKDEKTKWCLSCKQFVGTKMVLQHNYPEKYPDAQECEDCNESHFFYYHHCPICHTPRIVGQELYEKTLPLADNEIFDYCDMCQGLKKVKERDGAYLCASCFDKPWFDDDDDDDDEEEAEKS